MLLYLLNYYYHLASNDQLVKEGRPRRINPKSILSWKMFGNLATISALIFELSQGTPLPSHFEKRQFFGFYPIISHQLCQSLIVPNMHPVPEPE